MRFPELTETREEHHRVLSRLGGLIEGRSRSSKVVGWSLMLAVGLFGCGTRPALPPTYGLPSQILPLPPTEEVRKTTGTIGVAWLAETPRVGVEAGMIIGKGAGATAGAARGALAGAQPGAELAKGCGTGGVVAGLCALIALLAIGIGSGAGAVTGALVGHQSALPPSSPGAIGAVATQAATQLDLPRTLAEAISRRLRAETRHAVVGPSALPADPPDRGEAVAIGHVDSILKVSVRTVGFTGLGFTGQGGDDPHLALFVTAETHLLRATTGEIMYAADFEYRGPVRRLSAWTATGTEASYARALDRAGAALADRIVDEIFFVYLPREPMR